jgi:hypothetical protein
MLVRSIAILVFLAPLSAQAQNQFLEILGSGGSISAVSPNNALSSLSVRQNSSACLNTGKQAWVLFDLSSIPSNAVLVSATLQLRPSTGGDGVLYRCAVNPVGATWNSVGGNFSTVGAGTGVGANTGVAVNVDVLATVNLWLGGAANFGWVIKGGASDCTDTVYFGPGSGSSNAPRLAIFYFIPDTTAPRVSGVRVESTISVHNPYQVPSGSGVQLQTVSLAKPNRLVVTFNEAVQNAGSASSYSLADVAGTAISFTVSSVNSTTAALNLNAPITTPRKVILTVTTAVTDTAGNALDGEWTNPASRSTPSSNAFPSGNGSPGGQFVFRIVVLPGDFSRNNIVDQPDYAAWQANFGSAFPASFVAGDGNGDGYVDAADYTVWADNQGVNYTTW